MSKLIRNAHVFIDGEFVDVDVKYDDNTILEIGKNLTADEVIDANGNYLYAGFVETHQHGGFLRSFYRNGYAENGNKWCADDAKYILEQLPKYGVTSVLPTLDCQEEKDSCEALRVLRDLRKQGVGADPFAFHFEGPFLNPGRSACLDPNLCVLPSKEHTLAITDNDLSDVMIMCLAPELPGAEEWTKWVTSQGVHVEIGYTLCDSETIKKAADWGVDTTTHFFNGFEGMHHRKDGGMVGCMLEDRLTHQITCDGVHVAAPWIKLLIKIKGIDNIYGITDLFNFAGLEDGEYENDFYGTVVISGPRCCAKKDGMLLGGNLTWDKMMRSARDTIGLSEIEVAKMYGENPAKCLGIKDRGKIEVGRRSDFCLMDSDYHVLKTIIKGKIIYQQ